VRGICGRHRSSPPPPGTAALAAGRPGASLSPPWGGGGYLGWRARAFFGRRQRPDPPAGRGGARPFALNRRLDAAAPPPQQKGGDAGALGGQLQPAARHHRQPSDLGDDRGQPCLRPGAQPLFDRPQDVVVAPRRDQHEAGRVEPMRQQPRSVKIGLLQAPQHRTLTRPRALLYPLPHLPPPFSPPQAGES
jgi:hypothetical protein